MPTPVRLAFEDRIKYYFKSFHGTILNVGGGAHPYRDLLTRGRMINIDVHADAAVDVIADLCRGLPFKRESFDYVICTSVLEHIPQPEAMITEMHRVLKPQGRLLLYVPYLFPVHPDPKDYWRFSPDAFELLCPQFKMLTFAPIGGPVLLVLNILYLNLFKQAPHRIRRRIEVMFYRFSQRLDGRIHDADRWASGYLSYLQKD